MEAVVDANVLIHGTGSFPFDKAFLVQEVVDELESDGSRNVLGNLDYEVKEPGEEAVEKVEEKSEEINSPTSEADERLLALAVYLEKELVTDDKPLQNLALHLEHEFSGFLDPETDEKFRWEKRCDNCGEEVSSGPCPKCGGSISVRRVRCS